VLIKNETVLEESDERSDIGGGNVEGSLEMVRLFRLNVQLKFSTELRETGWFLLLSKIMILSSNPTLFFNPFMIQGTLTEREGLVQLASLLR
jgi:hypothetical protein